MTLTCGADANPPVHRHTWFKENKTGVWQAGSGQSLSFSNCRSWDRGQYYCEVENVYGADNSTAVTVKLLQGKAITRLPSFFHMILIVNPEAAKSDVYFMCRSSVRKVLLQQPTIGRPQQPRPQAQPITYRHHNMSSSSTNHIQTSKHVLILNQSHTDITTCPQAQPITYRHQNMSSYSTNHIQTLLHVLMLNQSQTS